MWAEAFQSPRYNRLCSAGRVPWSPRTATTKTPEPGKLTDNRRLFPTVLEAPILYPVRACFLVHQRPGCLLTLSSSAWGGEEGKGALGDLICKGTHPS